MTLPTQYNAKDVESKWYQYWMDKGYFRSTPDDREPYTIVIPPPNVTGVLHMGHMLNNTVQDVLIRKARLEGKNACWVPGTDHASIATEAKVVKLLREKGIKKSDISREEFLKYAFEWKDKYGGLILEQLKMLGASCDWERTRFTMEQKLSNAVIKAFVDLYKKGLLYRGLRMTNWDPSAQTVLSNEEVIHSQENSKLYHVRYKVEGTDDEWLTIATTRPETILADAAVAIHPDDERYTHLKGKKVIIPMVNRVVPIIFDKYVKMDFGTGALKVTPAHDMNDYEIGQRHNLEVIDMLHDNGRLKGPFYVGMDREDARKQIAKDLKAQGYLVKTENYSNSVGRSERTNAVVEPKLTKQWFLKMEGLSATALDAVENGPVDFLPEHMLNTYRNWLKPENVRDWCISRQLWWGQQIPAWYLKEDKEQFFVAETAEEALKQAQESLGNQNLTLEDLEREEDVVDTWFSSWLWPLSVFDAFEDPKELQYYYPTNVLVTGWDIMYLWVARMIMAGYEWSPELLGEELAAKKGVHPFKHVYFTGMVRDKLGRKMSKSLGNSPDSLELIRKYGADGVRYGILSAAAAGGDVIFDAPFVDKTKTSIHNESELCSTGSKFSNKLWNALRMVKGLEVVDQPANDEIAKINAFAIKWLENEYNRTLESVEKSFESLRLSEAVKTLYNFIWGDFCSWYLEMIKPDYQQPIDKATLETTIDFFEKIMTLLHPFMPFVTEEIWAHLRDNRAEGDDCTVSTWPKAGEFDADFLYKMSITKDLVSSIRNARDKGQLAKKELLELLVKDSDTAHQFLEEAGMKETIEKIAYLKSFEFTNEDKHEGASFIAGTEQYYLLFEQKIDVEAERKKLEAELKQKQGFVKGIEKKLSNEGFVKGAPAQVIEKERKKLADGKAKIQLLLDSLDKLN
ncbi:MULTISPECIES: valine--tRNA ligase [unclassified Aureispira]|uniref:valine--tRNA ligase n=1 Tax=unclassified Aureispira TaxID=2649989 RepID=UPI000698E9D6|nr:MULTISPECIES: valine--tRNA ligase [unclassified Aureispira]WMX16175.1 valine--tRNA ligase [Aureispira sp. CCB-E]